MTPALRSLVLWANVLLQGIIVPSGCCVHIFVFMPPGCRFGKIINYSTFTILPVRFQAKAASKQLSFRFNVGIDMRCQLFFGSSRTGKRRSVPTRDGCLLTVMTSTSGSDCGIFNIEGRCCAKRRLPSYNGHLTSSRTRVHCAYPVEFIANAPAKQHHPLRAMPLAQVCFGL